MTPEENLLYRSHSVESDPRELSDLEEEFKVPAVILSFPKGTPLDVTMEG
jgi:hypothetical protein